MFLATKIRAQPGKGFKMPNRGPPDHLGTFHFRIGTEGVSDGPLLSISVLAALADVDRW
jgi:hypothetical protein